jgi:hypothetical protein
MRHEQNVLRGRIAAAVRHSPQEADRLRAELKASRAADYIAELLANPAPTEADLCALALLIIGGER